MADGDGRGLAESLAHLPAGVSALVAVALADHQGVESIAKVSPRLHRLVVVAFEGFSEPELEREAMKHLLSAGIPVVQCSRGRLEEAMRLLETRLLETMERPASYSTGVTSIQSAGGRLPKVADPARRVSPR